MAFTRQKSAGKILSTLVVALLLAVAAGLYLQILLVDRPIPAQGPPVPTASIRVVEGDQSRSAAPPDEPLPSDQMDLIRKVFAPESLSR